MRTKMIGVLAATTCALALLSGQARATAMAGVAQTYWSAYFYFYTDPDTHITTNVLPAGVSVSCFSGGYNYDSGSLGCTASSSLQVISDAQGLVTNSLSESGGLRLTNSSGQPYLGQFTIHVEFSAFNPGGSEIGAMVDNPYTEAASFYSSVHSPGAFDVHGCNTRGGDIYSTYRTANACGVGSPDSSENWVDLNGIGAHGTTSYAYSVVIKVAAFSPRPGAVPEPASIALFGVGVLAAASRRRRRVRA